MTHVRQGLHPPRRVQGLACSEIASKQAQQPARDPLYPSHGCARRSWSAASCAASPTLLGECERGDPDHCQRRRRRSASRTVWRNNFHAQHNAMPQAGGAQPKSETARIQARADAPVPVCAKQKECQAFRAVRSVHTQLAHTQLARACTYDRVLHSTGLATCKLLQKVSLPIARQTRPKPTQQSALLTHSKQCHLQSGNPGAGVLAFEAYSRQSQQCCRAGTQNQLHLPAAPEPVATVANAVDKRAVTCA